MLISDPGKFHLDILNGFRVTERTRNSIENNQREITPKILKLECHNSVVTCVF